VPAGEAQLVDEAKVTRVSHRDVHGAIGERDGADLEALGLVDDKSPKASTVPFASSLSALMYGMPVASARAFTTSSSLTTPSATSASPSARSLPSMFFCCVTTWCRRAWVSRPLVTSTSVKRLYGPARGQRRLHRRERTWVSAWRSSSLSASISVTSVVLGRGWYVTNQEQGYVGQVEIWDYARMR